MKDCNLKEVSKPVQKIVDRLTALVSPFKYFLGRGYLF